MKTEWASELMISWINIWDSLSRNFSAQLFGIAGFSGFDFWDLYWKGEESPNFFLRPLEDHVLWRGTYAVGTQLNELRINKDSRSRRNDGSEIWGGSRFPVCSGSKATIVFSGQKSEKDVKIIGPRARTWILEKHIELEKKEVYLTVLWAIQELFGFCYSNPVRQYKERMRPPTQEQINRKQNFPM